MALHWTTPVNVIGTIGLLLQLIPTQTTPVQIPEGGHPMWNATVGHTSNFPQVLNEDGSLIELVGRRSDGMVTVNEFQSVRVGLTAFYRERNNYYNNRWAELGYDHIPDFIDLHGVREPEVLQLQAETRIVRDFMADFLEASRTADAILEEWQATLGWYERTAWLGAFVDGVILGLKHAVASTWSLLYSYRAALGWLTLCALLVFQVLLLACILHKQRVDGAALRAVNFQLIHVNIWLQGIDDKLTAIKRKILALTPASAPAIEPPAPVSA